MATLRKFTMTGFRQPVDVVLAPNITADQLEQWPAFRTWKRTLLSNLELQYTDPDHDFKDDPYLLRSVLIQSVDWFGRKVGFLKLKAVISNSKGKELPGVAFLRGGSVAVLMILRPGDSRDERWVVLTEQPRVPAGSLKFVEIPAGMIDEEEKFTGPAAKAILEETGFALPEPELINLTELALRHSVMSEPSMKNAMYLSPGGSDEFMPIFLWEKEVDRVELEDLLDKLTGKKGQGEKVTLRVVEYENLWREGARDAKTLAAWALYEGLNREGAIKQELYRRREELNRARLDEDTVAGAQEKDLIGKRQRIR